MHYKLLLGLGFLTVFLLFNPVNGTKEEDERFDGGAIYDGNSIKEFLKLCRTPGQSLDDPIPANQSCLHIDEAVEKLEHENEQIKTRKKMWENLRETQKIFYEYTTRLQSWEFHVCNVLLGIAVILGFYLCLIRHFDIRKIWDPYLEDPTKGIPSWQYVRMKYIASRITVITSYEDAESVGEDEEENAQENEIKPVTSITSTPSGPVNS